MKKFYVLLYILCLCLVVLGLAFYNHLFIGTAYILSKHIVLLISIFLLWKNKEKKLLISIPIVLIIGEMIFCKLNNYPDKDLFELRIQKVKREFCIINHNLLYIENPSKKYIDTVKLINPDFLALQEFNPKWQMFLDKRMKKNLKFNSCSPHQKDAYGLGFYSKHPILHTEYLEEYRGIPYCQIVDVIINSDTIRFYNTHFDFPAIAIYGKGDFFELLKENTNRRKRQYQSILENANQTSISKKIFCGDFNTMRIEPLYRNIKFDWRNAKNKSKTYKYTFKFQNHPPFLSLDHVFYKGNLKCNYSEVHRFGNSDHFPVISKFEY